jgi:hypothetical protein
VSVRPRLRNADAGLPCRRVRERLCATVDSSAPIDLGLHRHLRTCRRCSVRYGELRSLRDALLRLDPATLLGGTDLGEPDPGTGLPSSRWARAGVVGSSLVAAVAGVAAVVGGVRVARRALQA